MAQHDDVIADYRAAYAEAFPGRYLALDYWRGWYTLYTGGMTQAKYRRAEIQAMASNIRQRLAQERAA